MLFKIAQGTEQSRLLARPKHETDGALRPHAELTKNARGFDDDDAACTIVGRSVAGHPAVEMPASHHIARLRIGSRKVGDDIVALRIIVDEADVAADLEYRRRA